MKVITTHLNADFDCLGSIIAAKKIYPDARIVFPGAQEKNVRDFLLASDYSFQFDKLKNIKLEEITDLIIVDTRHLSRIGVFAEIAKKESVRVFIYDHHPDSKGDVKGDSEVILDRGATSTILTEILQKNNTPLTPDEATMILLGIFEDTGRFTFTSTRPEDFKAAAYLLSLGANLNTVSDFINTELSSEQISLLNDMLQNIEHHNINGLSISITTSTRNDYIGDIALLVHKIKDMEGLNVLIALVRMEERIHLIARSRVEAVDVSEIADEFGGGGHPTASSATIRDMTLPQVREKIIFLLKTTVHPVQMARDIMISHVKSLKSVDTIKEARLALSRYGLNAMPVLKGKKPIGIITRQIIEKAISHKLDASSVVEFMINDFSVVHEDAPYRQIDEIIILKNQRLIPVVNHKNEIKGVISRGDLLRGIYGDMLKKPAYIEEKRVSRRYPFTKNMNKLMNERLSHEIMKILQIVKEVADETGVFANLVGGFVRDLFLRIENNDIDIVIEGDGIQFAENFAKRVSGRVRSHKKFGTAVIILPDGRKIDIASTRIEFYEHPAALPMVEMSSQKHDLFRRDFTINSLSIRLNGSDSFKLVDYFAGQRDLKERVINVMHNLSFIDDPTRVFRAIRFEQRFNFTIGKQTLFLINMAVRRDLFNHLSGARLFGELSLILKEQHPQKMVKRMRELNVLRFIHPDITFDTESETLFSAIGESVSWYHLLFTGNEPEAWFIYLLGLIDNLSNSKVEEFCKRLVLSEKYQNRIFKWRKLAFSGLKKLLSHKDISQKDLYNILESYPVEVLLYMSAKTSQEWIKRDISFYITHLSSVKTELTGADLLRVGLKPGPQIGKFLKTLKEARLNGLINSKDEEMEFIKKKYGKFINRAI